MARTSIIIFLFTCSTIIAYDGYFDNRENGREEKIRHIYVDIRNRLQYQNTKTFQDILSFLQSQEIVERENINELYNNDQKVNALLTENIKFYNNYLPGYFYKRAKEFHPNISNGTVEDLFNLFKENNQENNLKIYDYLLSKSDFDFYFYELTQSPAVCDFVKKLIYEKIEYILKGDFGEDFKEVFDEFKAKYPNLDEKLILDDWALNDVATKFMDDRKNRIFWQTSYLLNFWFQQNSAINDQFLWYIFDLDKAGTIFDRLPKNKEDFLADKQNFLRDFMENRQSEFNQAIFGKIEKILTEIKPESFADNMQKLQEMKIEKKFTPQMFFVDNELKELVKLVLDGEICKEKVKKSLEDFISDSENFDKKNCIAEEVCSENPKVSDEAILEYFETYKTAFNRKFDKKRFEKNQKIKDEIDESIFFVIEVILAKSSRNLIQNRLSDKKISCFVEYVMREGKIDEIYAPELLFEEEKLREIINPMMREYSEKFKLIQ